MQNVRGIFEFFNLKTRFFLAERGRISWREISQNNDAQWHRDRHNKTDFTLLSLLKRTRSQADGFFFFFYEMYCFYNSHTQMLPVCWVSEYCSHRAFILRKQTTEQRQYFVLSVHFPSTVCSSFDKRQLHSG